MYPWGVSGGGPKLLFYCHSEAAFTDSLVRLSRRRGPEDYSTAVFFGVNLMLLLNVQRWSGR